MDREEAHKARKWAELRFATIGELLASPPEKGDLYAALKEMAEKEWQHPISGKKFKVSVPTLERWYYRAKNANHDMVSALVPKKRSDTLFFVVTSAFLSGSAIQNFCHLAAE